MKRKSNRLSNILTLALAMLVCGTAFTGCSQSAESPAAVETTAVPTQAQVIVGSICCDAATQSLTTADADPKELAQAAALLPQLKRITLTGKIPPVQSLLALHTQFPELELVCPVTLGDLTVSTDAQVLDLSGTQISPEELAQMLPLFFGLQELNLVDVPWPDEEKLALCSSLPGILVRCSLPLAGQYFLTDSTQIDISGRKTTVEEVEAMLPYFPQLKKLDMSFCGIDDAQMDALNQRHPQISIVWTVTIGVVKIRTDAIYFYPAEADYFPTSRQMEKLRYCTELIAIDIGHTRATDCEFLWYTPKVKYLILADTAITDISPVGNLKDLVYLELFNLRITDYSPLLNCTKLQDLNLGTTHADPEPLTRMTWLHNLQWHRADENPETRDAVLKLPEQLPDTNVVLYPTNRARNIGGPWRYLPNYYIFRDIIGAKYFNQDQIWDYWEQEDGDRIMACEGSSSAETLAEIVRERIDSGEPIIGIRNIGSEKAEILYQTLLDAIP